MITNIVFQSGDISNLQISIFSFLENNGWFNGTIDVHGDVTEGDKVLIKRLYHTVVFNHGENEDGVSFNIPKDSIIEGDIREENTIIEMNNENKTLYQEKLEEWLHSYHLQWGEIDRFYHKDLNDKNKYLIFTCAKNENEYIVEWINHYLKIGFDKIIICDNNDDESLLEVVKDYIDNGTVEVFDCRHFSLFQDGIMAMFCEGGNYKWCGYFDCDEFLEVPNYKDVKDYLSTIKEDSLLVHWQMHGSNGEFHKTDGNVQERFLKPVFPLFNINNTFVKSLIKGGYRKYKNIVETQGHTFVCKDNYNAITYNHGGYASFTDITIFTQSIMPIRYKQCYLKHYYTKSFDEWIKKSQRGWAISKGIIPTYRYFVLNSSDETYDIKKYKESLFIKESDMERVSEHVVNSFEKNDVVEITFVCHTIYAYLTRLFYAMTKTTGKTIVIRGNIDDVSYSYIMECGYVTGNRICFSNSDGETWRIYEKYDTTNNGYYWKIEI